MVAIAVVALAVIGGGLYALNRTLGRNGYFDVEGTRFSYKANKESVEKGTILVTGSNGDEGPVLNITVRYCNSISYLVAEADAPWMTEAQKARQGGRRMIGNKEYALYGGISTLMACQNDLDERSQKEIKEIFESLVIK